MEIDYKEVVNKVSTNNKKLKQKEYLQKGAYPVIDQGQELIGGYTDDETRLLDCALPAIVFGDHTKIVKLINFKFAPGADGTKVLEPKKFVLPKYLSYLTQILVFKIKDKGYARHYQHIEKQSFPIAPLPEQRAIVSKIEQVFSELDNGIANLKAAQDKLEIYRQAVLKKAFEGGFTELGKWESRKLGDIIKISSGNGLTKANRNDEGQYLVYGGNGVTGRHDDFMFEEQQLIIGRVGVHCGNTHITEPKCWVTDNAFVVTFDKEEITIKCLYYLIFSLRLNQYASSTAQPVISGGKVYPVEFLFPPKEIQGNLVDEIESRLSVCDNILANIEEGLEKSEALRQSILKQAFEGKLLSEEELEACRAAPDWEPAEKLLERIKNEDKVKSKKVNHA